MKSPSSTGFLFPESVLQSPWFSVFATFVAINTVVYVSLSISKLFPTVRFGRRRGGFNRRAEDRSIYVQGPELPDKEQSDR